MDVPTLPPSTGGIRSDRDESPSTPGLIVVFTGGAAAARVIRIDGADVVLGRSAGGGQLDDGRVSRRHVRIAFADGRCIATDLGSQNGTFADGKLVRTHVPSPVDRVLRIGDSLLVPRADVGPFERAGVRTIDGFVRGPAMQAVLEEAGRAARAAGTLHVHGETGSGKEGVARAFHGAGPRPTGPLVPVNCAAVPQALAERLLFGAKRGAYSGANSDAAGYLLEADGGTLFLDEVAELDLAIQAKLLRVLESRELLPLGASKPRKLDVAFCSATSADLRALVAAGRLREDLYFRIGRPAVMLPALRHRPEEIPALVAHALASLSPAPSAHISLVEQCLIRTWPGNVRELMTEIRAAAQVADVGCDRVEARHLAETAGSAFGDAMPEVPSARATGQPAPATSARRPVSRDDAEWRRRIEETLHQHAGNVAATARALGLHRTQLRRLMERHGIAHPAGNREDDGDDHVKSGKDT